jgi:hypothetical protein
MAAAWQVTIDKKLGIFREDKIEIDPLAKTEEDVLGPNTPVVGPHQLWTQVYLCKVSLR